MARTCKICKTKFEPKFNSVQLVCSPLCAIEYTKKQNAKKWKKEKKQMKEKLKTNSDYIKEVQKVFNSYIRERDKDRPCISCGVSLKGRKFDAGHYRSTGNNPELRFNESNVWGQCVPCNRNLHGNLIEYRKRLVKKIGKEKVEELERDQDPKKYTVPELVLLKEKYKEKLRILKNANQR